MKYYINKTTSYQFDEAVDRITMALKEVGFGILTEIDMKTTLKNKLDVTRPFVGFLPPKIDNVPAAKRDVTGCNGRKPDHGPPQCGFAAAGFTHQSKDITALQLKADTIYRLNRDMMLFQQTFTDGKVNMQIIYPQKRCGIIYSFVRHRFQNKVKRDQIATKAQRHQVNFIVNYFFVPWCLGG